MAKPNLRPDHNGTQRAQFNSNKKKIYATQKVCGICGKPVDFRIKFPDPLSPCIDHIIPVSSFFDMFFQVHFKSLPLSIVEKLEAEAKQHMEHAFHILNHDILIFLPKRLRTDTCNCVGIGLYLYKYVVIYLQISLPKD